MAAHLAPKDRVQRWAFLVMALGVGLAAFALASGSRGPTTVDSDTRGSTSEPSVLGVVVTRDAADPAAPATFDLPDASEEPADDQPARRTATTAPRRSTTSTTSTPGPTLIPPTVVDNTTTTSTADTTTSTTAG